MFRNYFKIAWRNLWRNKAFSFINVSGLALGMACSILILLWVKDEWSYNRFHAHLDQLYRVMEDQRYSGQVFTTDATPGPLAEALKEKIPEIVYATRITWEIEELFAVGETANKESGRYANGDLFEMFSFPLVEGNAHTALAEPNSVVISQKLARKYFQRGDAMGKTIRLNNREDFRVTGVMKDIPFNSSLRFDYVMPIEGYVKQNDWLKGWGNNGIRTFIMLRPDANRRTVEAKIKPFINIQEPSADTDLFLQPLADMYLHSDFRPGKRGGGRIEYVRLFSVVAVFILVIACINFMNLSTARSSRRAKEVGVRKVVGAARPVLIGQFLGESIFIAFLAILCSLLLAEMLLPSFNALTGKAVAIQYTNPLVLLMLLGIVLFTGLLSGSYPALFLSSLKPVRVLKGTLKFSPGAALFRKGLVIFQFTLSTILIISTLVVYNQVQYIKNKNLGLDKENLVYLPLEGDIRKNFEVFKRELLQAPGIKSVALTSQNPLAVGNSTGGVQWKGKSPDDAVLFSVIATEYDFVKTMDVRLKDGRDFSREFSTDSASYMINEEAAKRMRMKDPLGQPLTMGDQPGKIVGLVKDFHTSSLHTPIEPLIITLRPENASFVFVRTEPGKTSQALASLQATFHKYNPAYPFEYHFLDENFKWQYRSETIIGQLTNYFSFVAIFISCLGLFGLALFTAEQRTKEIGIRKVLGASASGIVALLSKDFLQLVLLANVIAWPLAWWAMHQWLQGFAYRISIGLWVFILAGTAALLIALLTVSYQAIKAALANPVESLRTE